MCPLDSMSRCVCLDADVGKVVEDWVPKPVLCSANEIAVDDEHPAEVLTMQQAPWFPRPQTFEHRLTCGVDT